MRTRNKVWIAVVCFFFVCHSAFGDGADREKTRKDTAPPKTLDEIRAPFPADAKHRNACPMVKELKIDGKNGEQFYLTIHFANDYDWPLEIAIWGKVDNSYRRLTHLSVDRSKSGPGQFDPIKTFHMNGCLLVHIPWIWDGTGYYREDWFYALGPDYAVERVELQPPSEAYRPKLKKDESVVKGEEYEFSDKAQKFRFYIWKKDDSNYCPTAGRVEGTFKLEGKPFSGKKARLVLDNCERLPVEDDRK